MIKQIESNIDVVTMARVRIKNVFESSPKVSLSISGGKDSICLSDLIFQMCVSGEIDRSKLVVDFIDEEAIYPCVENVVKKLRLQWISIGVEFRWWCVQVKHYNCLNQLSNDESFICWDETKKDVWIRPKPPFAISKSPYLKERKENYQAFLKRLNADKISLVGVRVYESIQRRYNIARIKSLEYNIYPIYDWKDTDVWSYIIEHNLEIPDAYRYMYQVGVPMNKMRISQFFSIDTMSSLVKMCEFYPNLFDKICKREPNAYMAMLYYDTELFRREKKRATTTSEKEVDNKARLFKLLKEDWRYTSKESRSTKRKVERLVTLSGTVITNKDYKTMCELLIAGDPKGRAFRSLQLSIWSNVRKES